MKHPLYDDQLIIITGALGFIGSCLVKHLNEKGLSNLLLVDDFDSSLKWKNINGKKFVDLISSEELFPFLEAHEREVEAIVHLGAISSTTETDGAYLYRNNYRYSVRLCQKALEYDKRFIIASSAATYGNGDKGFIDDEEVIETLEPLNPYALSKQLFDLWAKRHGVLKDIVSLKYFNIFGPNEGHKGPMSSLVYKMVPKILKEGKVQLFKSHDSRFADGDQVRDFLYVKEAAAMTALFLENDLGGLFNIGSGHPTTWNQLAKAVFKALGKTPHIDYMAMPESLEKAYQNYTLADMHKFNEKTRYTYRYTLETAVADYVQNYLVPEKSY